MSAEEVPVLDPAVLDRLHSWGGDELVDRMVVLFREQGRLRLEEVERALTSGEVADVGAAAHSLKSSAGNLGAERLREAAARLEAAASDGAAAEVRRLASTLPGRYDEAVAALDRARPDGAGRE